MKMRCCCIAHQAACADSLLHQLIFCAKYHMPVMEADWQRIADAVRADLAAHVMSPLSHWVQPCMPLQLPELGIDKWRSLQT